MKNLLSNAPKSTFPRKGTKPALLLSLIANGSCISRQLMIEKISDTYRSALQYLEGDKYGYWSIFRFYDENGKIISYQLDERHLIDSQSDNEARKERRLKLKNVSHKEALQGKNRLPKASDELQEALIEIAESISQAANDDLFIINKK